MKQIEFEHYRKSPHPFQHYGGLPPAALKNRSVPENYSSLPQGRQAFTNKIGRKQFQEKHQTNMKSHFGDDDTLSQEMKKYNHRIVGKSLETRDIQGAQGGSLKSPAVKYKQKAEELKKHGRINGFDKYSYEQEQYKLKIQNAVRSQHGTDMQIGKFISYKGRGYLNPQTKEKLQKQQKIRIDKNSRHLEQQEYYLKQKYEDFDTKDKNYKQFFSDLKDKEESYDNFFSQLKKQQKDFKSKQLPDDFSYKYKTLQLTKPKQASYSQQRSQQLLQAYKPPSFPKRSLESQFRDESFLGFDNRNFSQIQSPVTNKSQQKDLTALRSSNSKSTNQQMFINKQLARKLNPTHLSNILQSYNLGMNGGL